MRKLIALILFCIVLFSTACTTETKYGKCVGLADERDPALVYKVDTTNAILGIVFVESVFPTIFWLADDFYCPVAKRKMIALPKGFEDAIPLEDK